MLKKHGVEFRYRDYTKDPLDAGEIGDVLALLAMGPRDVLRSRDAKKAGIGPDVSDDDLIAAMAVNPRLLQRPIGVLDGKAELGRPIENLLRLR